jgi:inner membrane protein
MEGPSHVVFGLAGAVVLDSIFHLSGPAILGAPTPPTPDQVTLKLIFYGVAAVGALVPDIDNARSTLGKHLGVVSREIQKHAGHRTIFHSLVGLAIAGAIVFAVEWGLAYLFKTVGWSLTSGALVAQVALVALLVGYGLHLVADSLTLGGVPWLWPLHKRFGFPPKRSWRFRSGSAVEPVVVVAISVAVVVGLYTHALAI